MHGYVESHAPWAAWDFAFSFIGVLCHTQINKNVHVMCTFSFYKGVAVLRKVDVACLALAVRSTTSST